MVSFKRYGLCFEGCSQGGGVVSRKVRSSDEGVVILLLCIPLSWLKVRSSLDWTICGG